MVVCMIGWVVLQYNLSIFVFQLCVFGTVIPFSLALILMYGTVQYWEPFARAGFQFGNCSRVVPMVSSAREASYLFLIRPRECILLFG